MPVDATDSFGRTSLHHAGNKNWKTLPVFKRLNIAFGRNTRLLLVQMLFCLCLCAAVSGCLSCTEILWDFKANLDVQDGVSSIEHNTK